jgi:hypothetical protein
VAHRGQMPPPHLPHCDLRAKGALGMPGSFFFNSGSQKSEDRQIQKSEVKIRIPEVQNHFSGSFSRARHRKVTSELAQSGRLRRDLTIPLLSFMAKPARRKGMRRACRGGGGEERRVRRASCITRSAGLAAGSSAPGCWNAGRGTRAPPFNTVQ